MKGKTIGFALCGSFCTFGVAIPQMEELKKLGADIVPIMSPTAAYTDTRFGKAEDFRRQIVEICGHPIITTIVDAEPIGPRKWFDLMIIAPCTGNTLSKLALGLTDSSVTMAAKAHIRNNKPLLLSIATNDALAGTAANIGTLMRAKNTFFVPLQQDDPFGKNTSVVSNFDKLIPAAYSAINFEQYQPMIEGAPENKLKKQ